MYCKNCKFKYDFPEDQKYLHRSADSVQCRRFPEAILVDKNYWCGEFKEKDVVAEQKPIKKRGRPKKMLDNK